MSYRPLSLLIASVWLLKASIASAEGGAIVVHVTDLRFSGGTVHVDVCGADTFLKATCPYTKIAAAEKGTTTVVVPDVPPGIYAVQAFHDWNGNDQVDRDALGIPREGLAFSNDAPLGLRGPSFKHASFVHGAERQDLTMKLHHFAAIPKLAAPSP